MVASVSKNEINLREVCLQAGSVTKDTPFLRRIIREEQQQYDNLGEVNGVVVVDMANAWIEMTPIGNITLNYVNLPREGMISRCVLRINNPGSHVITWTDGEWAGGSAPSLTTSGKDDIEIIFANGSSIPSFYLLAQDMR